MGGAVSAGENNDELIDNLLEANYIKSQNIENIFRAVDRGNYYLPGHRDTAYHDLAWKHEHLHISAPCIYSEVMGSLDLKPGLSFLNIGSGTGYFSTMAGLMLGENGINHGIELHSDVVEYAKVKVEEFIASSHAFDRYTFCEPQFVVGNCLQISPDSPGYDRIYCGAACPTEYETFMKGLLNINGILVMPLNDQVRHKLQVITRLEQKKWESKSILSVNFASLVVDQDKDSPQPVLLPERNAPSLQFLCRVCVRRRLSENFHNGSNRIHKKKMQDSTDTDSGKSSTESGNRAGAISDSEIESETEKDSPVSKVRRSSSILNVATGTVTDVSDDGNNNGNTNDTHKTLNPSEDYPLEPPEQQESTTNAVTDSVESMEVESGEVTRKTKSNPPSSSSDTRLEDNGADKATETDKKNGSSNGKLKRTKRGCYQFLRRRHKNRKTEDSSSSSTQSNGDNSTETNSEQSGQGRTFLMYEETARNSDDTNDARRTTSVNIHVSSDSTTLRSFLIGMSSRSPSSTVRTNDLLSFITDRAVRRLNNNRALAAKIEAEGETVFDMEVNPSRNVFRHAMMQLPVPEAIKQYLLYYREQ
uniref:Protein-L-isoaspartate O-methyltransferase domain-containing protein 1 n=1 Tax=Phallusia mammillata TaxID=59560 RepID=A0A6F9DNY8_9ASCI|nr:protein-L-isoaspartate O-methyltransferase domain-containing protein 1 [Phallusia mammillata]